MRHPTDTADRRLALVVLALIWIPAVVSPCLAERMRCHPVAMQARGHDRAPMHGHECCVASGSPCVAETPSTLHLASTTATATRTVVADPGTPRVTVPRDVDAADGFPTYLRLRVLLI